MLILGIETSCDETGVAVVEDGKRILAGEVSSQIPLHARFGGVVPEIASRAHLRVIAPMLQSTLSKAGCSLGDIDAIAVTVGPCAGIARVRGARAGATQRPAPLFPGASSAPVGSAHRPGCFRARATC